MTADAQAHTVPDDDAYGSCERADTALYIYSEPSTRQRLPAAWD